jgi:hypothetical protein
MDRTLREMMCLACCLIDQKDPNHLNSRALLVFAVWRAPVQQQVAFFVQVTVEPKECFQFTKVETYVQ